MVYTTVSGSILNDAFCDCPGFHFNGNCSHVDSVEDERCTWTASYEGHEGPLFCPKCGDLLENFDTKAEYL